MKWIVIAVIILAGISFLKRIVGKVLLVVGVVMILYVTGVLDVALDRVLIML